MKVYISGTISKGGTLSDDERRANFARFYGEADRLRRLGHEPVNPLDLHPALDGVVWAQAMRADLRALLACDAISLLAGWEESRGARLEVQVARELGLEEMAPAREGEGDVMRDPQVGDNVKVSGTIQSIEGGVAQVALYRSYPVGAVQAVQCGALEYAPVHEDGAAAPVEERP